MNKLLNKMPVLDKGYVALYSLSITQSELLDLKRTYTLGNIKPLLNLPVIHIAVKCPIFMQLQFAGFNLHTLHKKGRSVPEAYLPSVNEVGAKDLETSEAIADDISRTTAALLLNPKSYQHEACDVFVSQVISPISIYNELIVSGTLKQWVEFLQQANIPAPVEEYRLSIEKIVLAEYNQFEGLI